MLQAPWSVFALLYLKHWTLSSEAILLFREKDRLPAFTRVISQDTCKFPNLQTILLFSLRKAHATAMRQQNWGTKMGTHGIQIRISTKMTNDCVPCCTSANSRNSGCQVQGLDIRILLQYDRTRHEVISKVGPLV